MNVKRYNPDDSAIEGREVVLASDFESLLVNLTDARCETQALSTMNEQQALRIAQLESELAALRNLSSALDSDASLNERMLAAGMFSAIQLLAEKPMDAFIRHAGVSDLATFQQWLEMKRTQFIKMQARLELAKREDDELFEWVMSHAATFSEVMINFRAAYRQEQASTGAEADNAPIPLKQLHWFLMPPDVGDATWLCPIMK